MTTSLCGLCLNVFRRYCCKRQLKGARFSGEKVLVTINLTDVPWQVDTCIVLIGTMFQQIDTEFLRNSGYLVKLENKHLILEAANSWNLDPLLPQWLPEYPRKEKKKGDVLWGIAVWCSWSTLWRPQQGDTGKRKKEIWSSPASQRMNSTDLTWVGLKNALVQS